MWRHLAPLCLLVLLLVGLPNGSVAQNHNFAALAADRITYSQGYKILTATGRVTVTYGTSRMEATKLIYNGQQDTIVAEGPIRLTDGDTITFLASYAELSGDMKNGLLQSARMVLNRQLQITAVEISRSEGRFNQLVQAAASSCTVTAENPNPIWQIRAKRIIHDEERKLLFFENAQMRIGRVPIAYIPRLRVPDPSVLRANGFLVPGASNSSLLGVGIFAPYFVKLGDYADVTLTPYVYSSGTTRLGFDFRKRFRNGALNASGAVAKDTQSPDTVRAYIFADGYLQFNNGIRAEMDLQFASDNSFLSDHGISNDTRLESRIELSKTTRSSRYSASVLGFRPLIATPTNDQRPFLLGEASVQHRWAPGLLGGQARVSLAANSYNRTSMTDIVGRDTLRIASVADWQRQWVGRSGLIFTSTAKIHADYYDVSQDSTYPTPVSRVVPLAALGLRLPMARSIGNTTEVIEPRLQVVWSPTSSTAVPDEDSAQVEFEATDLFALNHFAGTDQIEQGLRANVGVTYSRKSAKGWNVDAVLGKVLRAADPGQFTLASGLSGVSSSYVLAGQLALPSKFRFVQRAVFDNTLMLSKNETSVAYKNARFDVASTYLWLLSGAAGNAIDRSEWTVDGGLNLGNKWRTEASWRYDLTTTTPSDAAIALTYRNDCIKVNLSLSRRFAASSNVGDATNLGLQVTLEGFGGRADSDAYGRKCSAL